MNVSRIFFLAVLVVLTAAGLATGAQAQVGVYGMVTAENLKNIQCIDPQGTCAASGGTVKPYGGSFGVFYDFRTYGPVQVGFDLRGVTENSNKRADVYAGGTDIVRHYAGLGGVRATFRTPFKVLRPYAQASVGYAKTNAGVPPPNTYQGFTQLQGFVGLDLALFNNVDFRAMELGAGELFGNGNSHSIQSIGIGLVFHTSRSAK